MKIIYNLPRAAGKTTRMLYLSEHYQAPILCFSTSNKEILMERAKEFGIDIPDPLSINDIKDHQKNE